MSLISSDMQFGWVIADFFNQQVCKLTARRNAEAWMPASKSFVPVSELLLHRWIILYPTFCCGQCIHKTFKKWGRRTFVGQLRVTHSRGKTLCKMGWGPCRLCIESIKFAFTWTNVTRRLAACDESNRDMAVELAPSFSGMTKPVNCTCRPIHARLREIRLPRVSSPRRKGNPDRDPW